MEKIKNKACEFCERDEHEVPLVQIDFKGENYYICPQHIPVLIHDPAKLIGKLPGAGNLQGG